jgi:hypothetical protein
LEFNAINVWNAMQSVLEVMEFPLRCGALSGWNAMQSLLVDAVQSVNSDRLSCSAVSAGVLESSIAQFAPSGPSKRLLSLGLFASYVAV